ncbi:uncharacterized protein PV07_10368 [Cladophialophora immunda]|uniref:Uncharacterized protein n=1 Tax=Cladophialophora immunda TaxID=569365 RepID=A0A0D1ZAE0_9EURO|nr:uncharacterized protein PV07_10368 [Cladophialophora immunda]KIW24666.1 hypothetical protein PV07_10368 [Cladophialophora immunda]
MWRDLEENLYTRIRHLAADAFFTRTCTLETVQGFLLLNLWKEINDSVSPLHFGFAARITMDMRLGDHLPDLDDTLDPASRRRLRHHFHKTQETYLAMYAEDRMQSTLCVTGTTVSARAPAVQECAAPTCNHLSFAPQLRAMVTARLLVPSSRCRGRGGSRHGSASRQDPFSNRA